ncbi:hypothetical protein [Bosea minatitlanensis]|uniref:Uncharacterized protein n=1 Tax=Bosea minatitlanensis TaxID=128782 RepID=A0ABW0EWK1_9HYPH|nr:hypothetical protein [Bosea minatitlanensis]MCT4496066.1 hypothetical protein [Bosea minatitlanensis]
MDRKKQLDAVWAATHRDYKGRIEGRRTIMVNRRGTCLVYLEDLTDQEIAERLPKDRR